MYELNFLLTGVGIENTEDEHWTIKEPVLTNALLYRDKNFNNYKNNKKQGTSINH